MFTGARGGFPHGQLRTAQHNPFYPVLAVSQGTIVTRNISVNNVIRPLEAMPNDDRISIHTRYTQYWMEERCAFCVQIPLPLIAFGSVASARVISC